MTRNLRGSLPGAYARRSAPEPRPQIHFYVRQRIPLRILFLLTQRGGDIESLRCLREQHGRGQSVSICRLNCQMRK